MLHSTKDCKALNEVYKQVHNKLLNEYSIPNQNQPRDHQQLVDGINNAFDDLCNPLPLDHIDYMIGEARADGEETALVSLEWLEGIGELLMDTVSKSLVDDIVAQLTKMAQGYNDFKGVELHTGEELEVYMVFAV